MTNVSTKKRYYNTLFLALVVFTFIVCPCLTGASALFTGSVNLRDVKEGVSFIDVPGIETGYALLLEGDVTYKVIYNDTVHTAPGIFIRQTGDYYTEFYIAPASLNVEDVADPFMNIDAVEGIAEFGGLYQFFDYIHLSGTYSEDISDYLLHYFNGYLGNPLVDIFEGVVEALDVNVFGTFSPLDIITTLVGACLVVWLLKMLAGG